MTAEVKKSLHKSCPPSLLCREDQLHTLSTFIHSHITKQVPGAIYISGAPGTGKTACLSHILENSEVRTDDVVRIAGYYGADDDVILLLFLYIGGVEGCECGYSKLYELKDAPGYFLPHCHGADWSEVIPGQEHRRQSRQIHHILQENDVSGCGHCSPIPVPLQYGM